MAPMWEWVKEPNGGGHAGTQATAGADIRTGQLVRITGNRQVSPADNGSLPTTLGTIGVAADPAPAGGVLTVTTDGDAPVLFGPGLTLNPGDTAYLGALGLATNVPPTTPGTVLLVVGEIFDVSGYNPVAPESLATVVMDVEEPTPRT